jgi:hypothetical protein
VRSRLERPLRVGLVSALAGFALLAMLLAGCGGGGRPTHAKVEASLRQYIGNQVPEDSIFPVGAGAPRVRDNTCKDRHVNTNASTTRWEAVESRTAGRVFPFRVALWSCVVRFKNLSMPVIVALDDSKRVVWVASGRLEQFKLRQYKPTPFEIRAWKHYLQSKRR